MYLIFFFYVDIAVGFTWICCLAFRGGCLYAGWPLSPWTTACIRPRAMCELQCQLICSAWIVTWILALTATGGVFFRVCHTGASTSRTLCLRVKFLLPKCKHISENFWGHIEYHDKHLILQTHLLLLFQPLVKFDYVHHKTTCPQKTTNHPSVTGGVITACSVTDKHNQEASGTT